MRCDRTSVFTFATTGDPTDHRRGHVKLACRAGFALRDRVVRDKDVGILRDALQVAIIAIGVAGKDDALAAKRDAPRDRRNAAVNYGSRRGHQIRRFEDSTDFLRSQ